MLGYWTTWSGPGINQIMLVKEVPMIFSSSFYYRLIFLKCIGELVKENMTLTRNRA